MALFHSPFTDTSSRSTVNNPTVARSALNSADHTDSHDAQNPTARMERAETGHCPRQINNMTTKSSLVQAPFNDPKKQETGHSDATASPSKETHVCQQAIKSLTAQTKVVSRRCDGTEYQNSLLRSENQKLAKKASKLESELLEQKKIAEDIQRQQADSYERQLREAQWALECEQNFNKLLIARLDEAQTMLKEQNRDFGMSQDNLLEQLQEIMEENRLVNAASRLKDQENEKLVMERYDLKMGRLASNATLCNLRDEVAALSSILDEKQLEYKEELKKLKDELDKAAGEKDAIQNQLAEATETIKSEKLVLNDALKDFALAVAQTKKLEAVLDAQKTRFPRLASEKTNIPGDKQRQKQQQEQPEAQPNDLVQAHSSPINRQAWNNSEHVTQLQQRLQDLEQTHARAVAHHQSQLIHWRLVAEDNETELAYMREKLDDVQLELDNRTGFYGVMALD